MDPNPPGITRDFPPFFRVHATGHVERYQEHDFTPPSTDPQTGVVSRDAVVSAENNLSVRLYLPRATSSAAKLPLLVYIHGGAFSIQSAFSSLYHPYVNSLAAESQSVVISIEYRLAPEHPIPACYDDSYAAVKWIGSRSDPWLNEHADFHRVYVAGDSAGANIAHDMVVRSTDEPELGLRFTGLILIHPFFGSGRPDKLWDYICPDTAGPGDFRLNPAADLNRLSSKLGCDRVLVCLAEKDILRNRGRYYYEALKKSPWKGVAELFETVGEEHVFHLFNLSCGNAISMMNRVAKFINGGAQPMSHF